MRYNRPMNRQAALRFLPVLGLVAVLIANVPLIFQTAAPDLFFLVVAYSILALALAFYVFIPNDVIASSRASLPASLHVRNHSLRRHDAKSRQARPGRR